MEKLIIQIPCFNEQDTLAETVADLPKSIPGIDCVEYLVIDDGSSDDTVKVARENGVHHILSLGQNRGLAWAFSQGLEKCLQEGATIIVNTDADNQYDGSCIKDIVKPILLEEADMVVGARPVSEIAHFSFIKKLLQKVGSSTVRKLSGTSVQDAPSGMRAFSQDMAMRLFIHNEYTYTMESLIQAGQSGYKVESVPIRVNGETRPSRLVKNNFSYVMRSAGAILRAYFLYQPFRLFGSIAFVLLSIATALGFRFLWHYFTSSGDGMIQSLLLVVICSILGFISLGFGVVCDLNAANRRLLEDIRYKTRKIELANIQATTLTSEANSD